MSKTKTFVAVQIVCMAAFFLMSLASGSSNNVASNQEKSALLGGLTGQAQNLPQSINQVNQATDANGGSVPGAVAGYTKSTIQ